MREFGKTPRRVPWYKVLWKTIKDIFILQASNGYVSSHTDRMEKRRRKTKFDRW
ncbi:MAG: hypothetical protein AAGI23_14810 [Bacteroidota bacterium]